MARLRPKVEHRGDVRVFTFTAGRLHDVEDMIARDLDGHTDALGGCHLLLDCKNLERVTSVELGTLILLHKRLKAAGGQLTLFNMKVAVYEVFTVTRLHTFLAICREDEAQLAG